LDNVTPVKLREQNYLNQCPLLVSFHHFNYFEDLPKILKPLKALRKMEKHMVMISYLKVAGFGLGLFCLLLF